MKRCTFDDRELPTPLDEYQLEDGTIVCREHFFNPPERDLDPFEEMELDELQREIREIQDELRILEEERDDCGEPSEEEIWLEITLDMEIERRDEIRGERRHQHAVDMAMLAAWKEGIPIAGGSGPWDQMARQEA